MDNHCMKEGFVEGVVLDDRYESISPLNQGSFGMVFLANDRHSNDHVAIKCLSKQSHHDKGTATPSDPAAPTVPDENQVELACHATLGQHPNIVNMLRSFESQAHTYLVLEYCPMGDLYEAIRQGRGPLETENVREFMLQLVAAVEHMHARKLYHRDIKPENIFLMQDGSMKLGDLGLSTSDDWSHEASVGSDRYMAPEQFDPHERGGYSPAKADCWAIGICLLNVLFSRNPFVTPTESDVLFADFVRDSKSLFDIFPSMSDDTFQVLSAAMALDPAKRSLAGIRAALESVDNFTTDGESFDDFCTNVPDVAIAPANREPLRTPSITSPHMMDSGAFPWAKALKASPPPAKVRTLSTIADTESYSEDLFAASDADRQSWMSWAQNSSVTSGPDSIVANSVKSMALNHPPPPMTARHAPAVHSKPVPVPKSLPSRMPTLANIFSKKHDSAAKSWTDMYDEDEEEEAEAEEEEETLTQHRMDTERAARVDKTAIPTKSVPREVPTPSPSSSSSPKDAETRPSQDSNEDIFAFEDTASSTPTTVTGPGISHDATASVSRRSSVMDKWAALGNRRRQFKKSGGHHVEGGEGRGTRSGASSRAGHHSAAAGTGQVSATRQGSAGGQASSAPTDKTLTRLSSAEDAPAKKEKKTLLTSNWRNGFGLLGNSTSTTTSSDSIPTAAATQNRTTRTTEALPTAAAESGDAVEGRGRAIKKDKTRARETSTPLLPSASSAGASTSMSATPPYARRNLDWRKDMQPLSTKKTSALTTDSTGWDIEWLADFAQPHPQQHPPVRAPVEATLF